VLSFKLIDANHDGKISYEELKVYFPKLTKAEFAKYDTKHLGYYDHAELAAFFKAQKAADAAAAKPAAAKPAAKTAAAKPAATTKK